MTLGTILLIASRHDLRSFVWRSTSNRVHLESRQGRSIEVDFFRGIVLIVIVLNHVSGSALSQLTLHTYALCDSGEVLVFLGGYASAAAHRDRL